MAHESKRQKPDSYDSIKKAHAKTCQWFLKCPQYHDWLDANKFGIHNGLLWIKGKPGAGKSTLMKFIHSHARRTMKEKTIISFYFNARGAELEKSTVGLYRSLVLQLIEARSDLKYVLESMRSGHQWNIESLKSLFGQIVDAMGATSLICFIDALDECEEEQVRDMVSYFEEITKQAASSGTRLYICFASRHYPHISVDWGLGLIVERQKGHDQDMTHYISSKLRIGHGQLAKKIRSDIQEKAHGIFMWVLLVVSILNREFDRGNIHRLRQKLQEIPSDLHTLFRDILTRDIRTCDTKDTRGLLLCIQWILFASHPLTPSQLYQAVLSGAEPQSSTICHWEGIESDHIQKYILHNSKGLAALTKSDESTVQFIHQSVRDFFLDGGLGECWPDLKSNLDGQSHEELKKCCLEYLSKRHEDHALPHTFRLYAQNNTAYHAERAECAGVIVGWMKQFPNLVGNGSRILIADARLLYLLANTSTPASSLHECNLLDFLGQLSVVAAFGDEKMLAFILDRREININTPYKGITLLGVAALHGNEGTARLLLDRGAHIDRQDDRGQSPLLAAALNGLLHGNEDTVQLLLDKRTRIDRQDDIGQSPLLAAALKGHKYTVRLLLDRGAYIDGQDDRGQSLLEAPPYIIYPGFSGKPNALIGTSNLLQPPTTGTSSRPSRRLVPISDCGYRNFTASQSISRLSLVPLVLWQLVGVV
ncbi:hypothetical protein F5B20DRAFT_567549 [Whalleya microplaca]|nr:hypothetical protein F5B20DRAFT_567549 [Whalleya microplaca]